jgi:hypothetical protein
MHEHPLGMQISILSYLSCTSDWFVGLAKVAQLSWIPTHHVYLWHLDVLISHAIVLVGYITHAYIQDCWTPTHYAVLISTEHGHGHEPTYFYFVKQLTTNTRQRMLRKRPNILWKFILLLLQHTSIQIHPNEIASASLCFLR